MPQTINTNIASMNAQRNLNSSQGLLAVSMQRLSSGMRVNSAKDDAAGLAIAERMNTQVRGMSVAMRNANDGISLAQTAEGSLGKVGDMLQRMRELAVQAANGTNNVQDRSALNNEFTQLQTEVGRLIRNTNFNGSQILTGASTSFTFQVGANATVDDQIVIGQSDILTTTLGTTGTPNGNDGALEAAINSTKINILGAAGSGTGGVPPTAAVDFAAAGAPPALTGASADQGDPSVAVQFLDFALAQVNLARSTYGAIQNRFDSVIGNLQVAVENQTAARSRIMDADYAQETSNMSRAQILQQAGNAMVAQANQLPQQVLQLLKG
ncbi:flagellin [Pelomonas sp. Root1217]|uniref:flagellin N-terminal helical domain-containing protein n=1 Tax=Pelomonas sp. Root1217 TaxID=1736430 RepID=UPI00070BEAE4|nr:flagellin [Pelomonas sp. Root1217]KQV59993.1 flagellin [Pelomonas sp. Root1217]